MVNDSEIQLTTEAVPLTTKLRIWKWMKYRFLIAKEIPGRSNLAVMVLFLFALNMEMALTIPGIPTGLGIVADYFIIGTLYLLGSTIVMVVLMFLLSFFYLRKIAGWLAGTGFICAQTIIILFETNWGWKATLVMTGIILFVLMMFAWLVSYLYAYKRKPLSTVFIALSIIMCIIFLGFNVKSYWNELQRRDYVEQFSGLLLNDLRSEELRESTSSNDDDLEIPDVKQPSKEESKDALIPDIKKSWYPNGLNIELTTPGNYTYKYVRYSSEQAWQDDDNNSTIYIPPMNGSSVLQDWSWTKELFWGFTEQEISIRGQMWIPEGEGPFPIVFIMHGNHLSEEDSSDGYRYLGELLASHGMIVSSIDANFLNYSVWSGIVDDDQKLRSWLMLAHLSKLKEQDLQADWNNVALIGHSRGGQAAAMAVDAKKWYPDEEVISILDEVNIKAVIAIAPTDYRVDSKLAYLSNVNYLTLHGTMDSDLTESFGERQYERTTFTQNNHFKATVELYHANHGQFNTIWGKYDEQFPGALALNTAELMNGEDQRKAAQLFIHSFLKASFTDDTRYEAVFQDYRVIGDQLPLTGYVSRYSSSKTKYWLDFEREATSENRIKPSSDAHASVIDLKGRSDGDKQNKVLWVSWEKPYSSIELTLNNIYNSSQQRAIEAIVVSFARAERMSPPKLESDELSEVKQNEIQLVEPEQVAVHQELEEVVNEEAEVYTGLKVEMKLQANQWGSALLDLEPYYNILHPAAHDFTKLEWLEENIKKGKYDVTVEPLLQTYIIPIALIEQEYPRDGALFVSDVETLTFTFKNEKGSIIIDALGYITEGGHYVTYSR